MKKVIIYGMIGIAVIYVSLYYATTHISARHGSGGLSGPYNSRVFENEKHLLLLLPIYQTERLIRTNGLAQLNQFGCEMADGKYEKWWMYGDLR